MCLYVRVQVYVYVCVMLWFIVCLSGIRLHPLLLCITDANVLSTRLLGIMMRNKNRSDQTLNFTYCKCASTSLLGGMPLMRVMENVLARNREISSRD